jgi:RTX calcium-binding nonapeptide repeat (4 copies)
MDSMTESGNESCGHLAAERGRTRCVVALISGALVLGSPAPDVSHAATLTGHETGGAFQAAAGEQNRIVVTRVDAQTIRVSDTGAVIASTGSCRSIDAHTADCSTPVGLGALGAITGDMNDEVRAYNVFLGANGGHGDDTLVAAQEVDAMSGAGWNANLDGGGGGHDTLVGSATEDSLADGDVPGAADSDIVDGRGGHDWIMSYAGRTSAVRVDLGTGYAGETGEADRVARVEQVAGGYGPDEMWGGSGADAFSGYGGADRLYGRGGGDTLVGGTGPDALYGLAGNDALFGQKHADTLIGGTGADRLSGSAGNDLLEGGPGADWMSGGNGNDDLDPGFARDDFYLCGPDRDHVHAPNWRELLARDCERATIPVTGPDIVGFRSLEVEPYPRGRDSISATFRLRCPQVDDALVPAIAAGGTLRVREAVGARRTLGVGQLPAPLGRRCALGNRINAEGAPRPPRWILVRVKLNELGRRLWVRPRGVHVLVSLSGPIRTRSPWAIALEARRSPRVRAFR